MGKIVLGLTLNSQRNKLGVFYVNVNFSTDQATTGILREGGGMEQQTWRYNRISELGLLLIVFLEDGRDAGVQMSRHGAIADFGSPG